MIMKPKKKTAKSQSQSVIVANKEKVTFNARQPQDQVQFIDAVSEYARGFSNAKNELQQSVLRDQRKLVIANLLDGYSITSWVGTINILETNTDGNAILSVRISPDIEVKTWNNALSDINSNTLIEKELPIYNSLFELSSGQQIEFSGDFFPSKADYIEETSMTIDGSMRNPEFLFKFKSIKPIN